jgi:phosphoribosylformylglycinamidine synthase
MILFFKTIEKNIIAVESPVLPGQNELNKLIWLFGEATYIGSGEISGNYVGPRKEMVTPWSTNAVEITQNMGISGLVRIEEYFPVSGSDAKYDHMLQVLYHGLDQNIFRTDRRQEPVFEIEDIASYNEKEGLALSGEEIKYLEDLSKKLGRKLTDSEVFGFSQVNSEHCRCKLFDNRTFNESTIVLVC